MIFPSDYIRGIYEYQYNTIFTYFTSILSPIDSIYGRLIKITAMENIRKWKWKKKKTE